MNGILKIYRVIAATVLADEPSPIVLLVSCKPPLVFVGVFFVMRGYSA
jgi:hypothetical protein